MSKCGPGHQALSKLLAAGMQADSQGDLQVVGCKLGYGVGHAHCGDGNMPSSNANMFDQEACGCSDLLAIQHWLAHAHEDCR